MTAPILRRLALDAVAAEVVADLRRHGIEPILLKGRSIVERLYADDPSVRTYLDVDLLVPPDRHGQAARVLAALGFADALAGSRPDERCRHADAWVRPADRVAVDLHRTLPGPTVAAARVWSLLAAHTRPLTIGGVTVAVLADAALAMHVVLHAAQHGIGAAQPLADLRRALVVFDDATMTAAAQLATELGALPPFVAGLLLTPDGAVLADRVGRGVTIPVATTVGARTAVRGTGSIASVLAQPGGGRPLAAARRVFPSRTVLRRSMPVARRGTLGLAAAYVVRPFWMAVKLPAAVRAWRSVARS